ncbi:hypothetical protein L9F63_007438, partial [Diploptera punctata]
DTKVVAQAAKPRATATSSSKHLQDSSSTHLIYCNDHPAQTNICDSGSIFSPEFKYDIGFSPSLKLKSPDESASRAHRSLRQDNKWTKKRFGGLAREDGSSYSRPMAYFRVEYNNSSMFERARPVSRTYVKVRLHSSTNIKHFSVYLERRVTVCRPRQAFTKNESSLDSINRSGNFLMQCTLKT